MKMYWGLAGFMAGTLIFMAYEVSYNRHRPAAPRPTQAIAAPSVSVVYVQVPVPMPAPSPTMTQVAMAQPPPTKPVRTRRSAAPPKDPVLRLATVQTDPSVASDPPSKP